MSIQKKSLISALKTTKKANVASAPLADNAGGQTVTSAKKVAYLKRASMKSLKRMQMKSLKKF